MDNKDKVREEIAQILAQPVAVGLVGNATVGYLWEKDIERIRKQILAIPELAVVEREAGLPREPEEWGIKEQYTGVSHGYKKAQQDMIQAGWVKEAK